MSARLNAAHHLCCAGCKRRRECSTGAIENNTRCVSGCFSTRNEAVHNDKVTLLRLTKKKRIETACSRRFVVETSNSRRPLRQCGNSRTDSKPVSDGGIERMEDVVGIIPYEVCRIRRQLRIATAVVLREHDGGEVEWCNRVNGDWWSAHDEHELGLAVLPIVSGRSRQADRPLGTGCARSPGRSSGANRTRWARFS